MAYFFVKELYQKYNVPMGIINATLGGSPAEAWMSADALKEFPAYLEEAKKFADTNFVKELKTNEQKAVDDWYAQLNQTDKGLLSSPTWKNPEPDYPNWIQMPVPGYWADHGYISKYNKQRAKSSKKEDQTAA